MLEDLLEERRVAAAGCECAGQCHGCQDVHGTAQREVAIEAIVRSQRPDGAGRTILGLEFLPDQNQARAALALALFQTTVVDARSGQPIGTRAIADVPQAPDEVEATAAA